LAVITGSSNISHNDFFGLKLGIKRSELVCSYNEAESFSFSLKAAILNSATAECFIHLNKCWPLLILLPSPSYSA